MGRTGRVYRRVRSRFTSKPTYFGWVLEKRLAASGLPSSRGQVDWIKSQGIGSILTLTEDPLPKEWLDGSGLSVKNVPMLDHVPPTKESLEESSEFIKTQLDGGKAVLVHCLAGVGRTGCALAAYLMDFEDKTADQAIAYLRSIRPGSVEDPQEEAVRAYEALAKARRARR